MKVIARLEYELAYYDSAVHRFNHYTTRTPLKHHEDTPHYCSGESKVLQYLIMWGSSAALDVFAEVVKVMSYSWQWDAKLAWYSEFSSMIFSIASEYTVLGHQDLAWSSKFWQTKQNCFNNLLTVLWSSTVPSPFVLQIFLIAFAVLWLSSNL